MAYIYEQPKPSRLKFCKECMPKYEHVYIAAQTVKEKFMCASCHKIVGGGTVAKPKWEE